MTGPRADDEEQLATTHTVTPAHAGVAVSETVATGPGVPVRGDVISGKYRIEECLGKGGMGMVFRATHLFSEKRVAVKWMLRPTSDPQATGRFVREARAAARIDHANVVDVYDVGEHGGFGYLVMELLHGESLWERLGRGTLGITEAVDLVLPAMRGVAAAHAAGVIHRDLKPHNLFLCAGPDGAAREAKVLDFGISSFTNADAADPTLTQEGTILGTPAYMSPEQLRSSVKLDPRTDVYSMGVILYEAVTGRVPFEEPSFTSLVLAIANAEPPAPSALRPELSAELEHVIMRAIARNRDERFQDMLSFIAALEPFCSHLRASGPRTAPTMAEPVRREVDPAAHTTPAPLLLSPLRAATLELTPDPGPSSGSQDPVPPVAVPMRRASASPAPSARRWPGLLAIAVIALLVGWWIARGDQPGKEVGAATGGDDSGRAEPAQAPRSASERVVGGPVVPGAAADSTRIGVTPVAEPGASGTEANAAGRVPPIAGSGATHPEDAPAGLDQTRPVPARVGSVGSQRVARPGKVPAQPAAAEPAAAPRPPAGRSGTLSLDDML